MPAGEETSKQLDNELRAQQSSKAKKTVTATDTQAKKHLCSEVLPEPHPSGVSSVEKPCHCEDGRVSQALRRTMSGSSSVPETPPDGGYRAWLCVLGTAITVMNTWGVINSFGTFQSYYVETLNRSPSDISWIGSIEIFLLFFVGTFTGRLTDAGHFHSVAITGTVLLVTGTFTTSVCSRYWQTFLAQGVCVGLGNGCLFCPTITLVSTYFQKHRAIAIGLTACGGGVGGIIFPSLVRQLLPRVGFMWTMLAIAFIQAGSMVVALFCLKPRTQPRKTGSIVDWKAFKELEYVFYALGCFLCFWGTFTGFFFIASYARDILGMSYIHSLDLVMIMNAVGTIGRILPNYLADRFGTLTMFIPTAAVGALLMYFWMLTSSPAGMYGWTAICGIILGAIQSLFPAALAALTTDPRKQGSRIGLVFTIVSFSVLTGPPITGLLISALQGRYIGAQVFAGSCLVTGTGFLVVAREVKRRKMELINIWAKV